MEAFGKVLNKDGEELEHELLPGQEIFVAA